MLKILTRVFIVILALFAVIILLYAMTHNPPKPRAVNARGSYYYLFMVYLSNYLSQAKLELVSKTEYRTKSELLTSAYFFTLPRDDKMLDVEAFATLFMAQLCYFEEWNYAELDETDFALIEQNQLKHLLQAETQSTILETLKEINLIIDAFVAEPEHQIFTNNLPSSHTALNVEDIVSSTLYFGKWNHIEVLLKTKTDFKFFSWATGA
ncbi:MAG: hypothetical protein RLZZ156_424 [Deinococcota bacterium]|jgi:hypothetical protein